MSLPQGLMDRLWQALTLDANGNVAFRTTAATLAAGSVKNSNMSWGTTGDNVSAVDVPIADAGSYFATKNVEAALQSLGASVAGGGAPANATYIIQVANGTLTNAQVLASLSTGLLKVTTTTGVLSTAVQGTDYYVPGGTKVALADGGANAALVASAGGIVYSTASALAVLAGTATANQVLLSGLSAAPAWSTATYPATTTINQLLYSSAANTVTGLATANSGVLVTNGTGVPSISTDIPTAVTIGGAYVYRAGGTKVALADGGANAALTASNGGIVYSTASALAVLAGTATAGQILRSGSSAAPSWSTATYPATAGSAGGILRSDGTNFVASTATYPNTTTINQILYSSAANTITGLATADSAILNTSSSGVPSITAMPIIGTSLQIGIASTATGSLKLGHASSANLTTIQPNASAAAVTYVLPAGDAGVSGQALTSDGSGNLSWKTISASPSVFNKTSNYTLLSSDSGNVFTNTGATGVVVLTLPAPVAGQTFEFVVAAAQVLQIQTDASTTLLGIAATAGRLCSNNMIYSSLSLLAIDATHWIARSTEGTWNSVPTKGYFGGGFTSGGSSTSGAIQALLVDGAETISTLSATFTAYCFMVGVNGPAAAYTLGGQTAGGTQETYVGKMLWGTETTGTGAHALGTPDCDAGAGAGFTYYANAGYKGSATLTVTTLQKINFSDETTGTTSGNLPAYLQNSAKGQSSTIGYLMSGNDGGGASTHIYKLTFSTEAGGTAANSLATAENESSGLSSSSYAYACGGISSHVIQKMAFSNEAVSTLAATLTNATNTSGLSGLNNGYCGGGNSTFTNIDRIHFADDTKSTLAAVVAGALYGMASFCSALI